MAATSRWFYYKCTPIHHIVKERTRHKTSRTLLPASLPALPPEFFRHGFCRAFRRFRSAIQRRVVFGEALSTDTARWPQVENDGKMTIFSAAQEFLGFLLPLPHATPHFQAGGTPAFCCLGRLGPDSRPESP